MLTFTKRPLLKLFGVWGGFFFYMPFWRWCLFEALALAGTGGLALLMGGSGITSGGNSVLGVNRPRITCTHALCQTCMCEITCVPAERVTARRRAHRRGTPADVLPRTSCSYPTWVLPSLIAALWSFEFLWSKSNWRLQINKDTVVPDQCVAVSLLKFVREQVHKNERVEEDLVRHCAT